VRRVRVGDSSGKVRLLRPVADLSNETNDEDDRAPGSWSWRAHAAEIAFVAAVWLLALVQVGLVVARGGTWTPDSELALAFALACPFALYGFRRIKNASP
jgi:hypothetical protein